MDTKIENKREKVIKYLNKNLSELIDEQRQNETLISVHEAKIKEMYNAISIAEKEIDPNYNLFSPKKSGKVRMNDQLLSEVHILENELEQYKFKNKKILEKICTTKDIITCIVGEDDEDLFTSNSMFLDSLISEQENENNRESVDNNQEKSDALTDDSNSYENSSDNDFEIVNEEIEESEELFISDELGKKFLNIQESEKNRIARDLHDTTVQNLTSLVHKTELCMKLVDMDSVRTKLELQTIVNTLRDSINELRQIIYGLKPMSLDDFGLSVTVRRFIEQLNLEIKPKFFLETEGSEQDNLDPVIKLTLFRIIQEACNNAIKHSNADRVDILIDFMDDCINVIIVDDGDGFDHDEVKSQKDFLSGYGIPIMKERTFLLGGKISIGYNDDNDKSGTKIIVNIPIKII